MFNFLWDYRRNIVSNEITVRYMSNESCLKHNLRNISKTSNRRKSSLPYSI